MRYILYQVLILCITSLLSSFIFVNSSMKSGSWYGGSFGWTQGGIMITVFFCVITMYIATSVFFFIKIKTQDLSPKFFIITSIITLIIYLIFINSIIFNLTVYYLEGENSIDNSKRIDENGRLVCYIEDINQKEFVSDNLGIKIIKPEGWVWSIRDNSSLPTTSMSVSDGDISKVYCYDYLKYIRIPYVLNSENLSIHIWLDSSRSKEKNSVDRILQGKVSGDDYIEHNLLKNIPNKNVLVINSYGTTVYVENSLCGKVFSLPLIPRNENVKNWQQWFNENRSEFMKVLDGFSLIEYSYKDYCPAFQPD